MFAMGLDNWSEPEAVQRDEIPPQVVLQKLFA